MIGSRDAGLALPDTVSSVHFARQQIRLGKKVEKLAPAPGEPREQRGEGSGITRQRSAAI
jgi:hypothetical protein